MTLVHASILTGCCHRPLHLSVPVRSAGPRWWLDLAAVRSALALHVRSCPAVA